MKAAQISEYGDAGVVHINKADKPAVLDGQVLVEVHASSVNPFDSAVRNGTVKAMMPALPVTLGGDIAGVVTEVGSGVRGLAAGERVYGQANVVAGNSGAWAGFAATAVGQVARAPEGLDSEQAAALPLVGVSALQGLNEHLGLAAGQKLFIHGGAGGVGSIAIQIAKYIGSHVATTAKALDRGYVRGLGADEVIDYQTQDFAEVLHDYDAVFDTVGGDEFNKALGILKRGGKAVSMLARADEARARELGVTAITQGTKVTTEALDALRELVESGEVTPQVGQVFPLEQIQEAMRARESGSVRGKVVIKIQ